MSSFVLVQASDFLESFDSPFFLNHSHPLFFTLVSFHIFFHHFFIPFSVYDPKKMFSSLVVSAWAETTGSLDFLS